MVVDIADYDHAAFRGLGAFVCATNHVAVWRSSLLFLLYLGNDFAGYFERGLLFFPNYDRTFFPQFQ